MLDKGRVWFIIFLILLIAPFLLSKAFGEELTYSKVKMYDKQDQNCFVRIEIKQNGDTVTKQEILECSDGRRGINTPGYWELFAQFYYRDTNQPEYCREYSREKHAFKKPGKVCLTNTGEWRVK